MQKNQINTSEGKYLSLLSKIKNLALSLRKVLSLIKNAIVNNAQKIVDAIKSPKIKKQALVLFVSAVMLTSAGCGEITPETQETNQIIHENTESEYAETSVLEKYEDVEGYVSDLANEILNDPKYPEYKATYNEEKQTRFDCYGTSLNPTCYDYYHKLYPNATDEEILNLTRVYAEYYGETDNSLYVVMVSSPLLSDNVELGADDSISLKSSRLYTLFYFENLLPEEQRDLIITAQNKDILNHSLLLNSIFKNNKYTVLAENLNNRVDISNKHFVLGGKGTARFSISTLQNQKKYNYTFAIDPENNISLYYCEAELTDFDKEWRENSHKVEGISQILISNKEELKNIMKCDDILFYNYFARELFDVEKENTP